MNKQPTPFQKPVPWKIAFFVSWSNLKKRIFRSFITMTGVILAIAFLTYMLSNTNFINSLIMANDSKLNVILQKAGIDIFTGGKADSMMILLLGLSLLTCLVGIVNSMLMSVTERIKEIGTLKCLGALDKFIIKIYFIESTLQGIIGTAAGLIIGLIVAFSVNLFSYGRYILIYFPGLNIFKSVLISLSIGIIISILSSIAPAYWAAKKEPVEALREEV